MEMREIAVEKLESHPANSNVMSRELLAKLKEHIRRTGRYPPIIVRPMKKAAAGEGTPAEGEAERYQILDGHHRVKVLRELGYRRVRCVVWEVDDAQALVLVATLNRLAGRDDPLKRAALIEELAERWGRNLAELERLLPERKTELERLLELRAPPPRPGPPPMPEATPVPVYFFLLPADKRRLEACLSAIGAGREGGLMKLVEWWEKTEKRKPEKGAAEVKAGRV